MSTTDREQELNRRTLVLRRARQHESLEIQGLTYMGGPGNPEIDGGKKSCLGV